MPSPRSWVRTRRTVTPGSHGCGELVGNHGTGHVQPGPRTVVPGRLGPGAQLGVAGVEEQLEPGLGQVPLGRDLASDVRGPIEERGRQLVGAGERRVDHDAQVAAAGGPVVHARPGHECAVRSLDDDLAPGPRADADHLALHEVGVDRPVLGRQRASEVDESDQVRDVAGKRSPCRQALRERWVRVGRLLGEGTVHRVIVPPSVRAASPAAPRGRRRARPGRRRSPAEGRRRGRGRAPRRGWWSPRGPRRSATGRRP